MVPVSSVSLPSPFMASRALTARLRIAFELAGPAEMRQGPRRTVYLMFSPRPLQQVRDVATNLLVQRFGALLLAREASNRDVVPRGGRVHAASSMGRYCCPSLRFRDSVMADMITPACC
jgi:hypothetical protein